MILDWCGLEKYNFHFTYIWLTYRLMIVSFRGPWNEKTVHAVVPPNSHKRRSRYCISSETADVIGKHTITAHSSGIPQCYIEGILHVRSRFWFLTLLVLILRDTSRCLKGRLMIRGGTFSVLPYTKMSLVATVFVMFYDKTISCVPGY